MGDGQEEGHSLIARDQVGEAYFGRFGNRETSEKTRNRIYWMANQLEGERVLDIGCSEGILAVLAGREGYDVVGLDLNEGAIAYANELLSKEPEEVRARVDFRVGDLATFANESEPFDTLVAGEVIEHLIAPRRFLEICAGLLKENGALILTTPFGVSSNDDHKQTFFPGDLAELFKNLFAIDIIEIADGYIRLVARKSEAAGMYDYPTLLALTEDGAFAAQESAQSLLDERRRKITQQAKQMKTTAEKLKILSHERNSLKAQIDTVNRQLLAAKKELDKAMKDAPSAGKLGTLSKLVKDHQSFLVSALTNVTQKTQRFRLSPIGVKYASGDVVKLTRNGLRYRFPVEPRREYIYKIGLDRRLPETRHEALVKFKYFDSNGAVIKPPYPNTVLSESAGAYRYLNPSEFIDNDCCLTVKAPEDAALAEITVAAWRPMRRRSLRVRASLMVETTITMYTGKSDPLQKAGESAYKISVKLAEALGQEPPERPTAFSNVGKSVANKGADTKRSASNIADRASVEIPEPSPDEFAPRFLSILDEFTETALKYDAHLTRLSVVNWKRQIDEGGHDALLVESAWRGNDQEWNYALSNPKNKRHEILKEVIEHARNKGLPAIFWNKEDPPNYDVFIEAAKLFDYIFTTDVNCVEKYKSVCGHDRVWAMPFFAQPKIHNPIGKKESDGNQVVFAGSWYAQKHQDRSALAPIVFDAAADYKFTIYNRHSDQQADGKYEFPDKYKPFLKPKISYAEMLSAHKSYQVFLNVNSVTDSETMFARRIFEVLACSTPIISTASSGVEKLFGDVVPVVNTPDEAKAALGRLLSDDEYRRKTGHLGYRKVLSQHTARDRLSYLCEKSGLSYATKKAPKVTWAASTNRPEHLNNIIRNYLRQDYPDMELIVALNSDEFDKSEVERRLADVPNSKVLQLSEECFLGDCLNATIDVMTGDYWFKIDDDDIYFEHYTSDMMLPFMYSEARIAGKQSVFSYLESEDALYQRFPERQHCYVNFVSGATIAVDARVFDETRFVQQKVGTDTQWMRACAAKGEKIYSADPYNFILIRRGDKSTHTWQAEDHEVARNAVKIADGFATDRVRV